MNMNSVWSPAALPLHDQLYFSLWVVLNTKSLNLFNNKWPIECY